MTNILTLRMDERSQRFFDGMRERHFPPALNRIGAHVTLFHTLPGTVEVAGVVARVAAEQTNFVVLVTGLRSLGKGVAYTLASPELLGLQKRLAAEFREHLSAQDAQRFMPHIVVQNKVSPEKARALLAELTAGFKEMEVRARGLELWEYLGGPWRPVETFLFR